ncbi:hypothetical protein HMPREF9099_00565 [Lachnospiraceae bacterium oral taxon 082 str. F0431]|nr:hypothetical protein HMPREF9099_00565 [Lachnospiraceae bacterium oral taxon 082 str. F0431]
MKNIIINLEIILKVDKGNSINIVEGNTRVLGVSILEEQNVLEHVISETENRYGILTLGSKSLVGKSIQKETTIKINIKGKEFNSTRPIRTHRVTQGRIDGLTQLFRAFPEELGVGKKINVTYDSDNRTISIDSVNEE